MLEDIFRSICKTTWLVDIPRSPRPYPYGTKFKITPKRNGDLLTDWTLKVKLPRQRYKAPKCQLMKQVTDLGGLVYLSVLIGDDKNNLKRMTMSFDCRHPSDQRKSFYFQTADIELPGCEHCCAHKGTKPKIGDPDAKGSGRPD